MSYEAQVIEVMIASPGDVSDERKIAREVILEWNAVHARDRKLILLPMGWETHSAPAIGDRPQAIINGQMLKHADLLIAIFWTRLGTSTGVAASGTVEEIEEHIKAGKPAMIYFSSKRLEPDSIEPDQYAALKTFKASMKDKGLYEQFDSAKDFEAKLNRQLRQTVLKEFPMAEASLAASPASSQIPRMIDFGEEATELLIEATKDPQGIIMRTKTMSGLHIQTNRRQFAGGDARSQATWEDALRSLESLHLVQVQGGKGEVFRVTKQGYKVADDLIKKFPDLADEPPASHSPAP